MQQKQRAGMSARTFWRGVLWILLLWLVATLALAANTAWMELHPPAASPAPAATPRADTTGQAINCHQNSPPTHSPYLAVARTDAQHYGIDALTFEWKIMQESGFNPNVHDSPAGAIGIAQFEPATAQGMGIDPRNPRQALDASARLDAEHLRQYATQARKLATHYGGNGARYAYGLALSAYNAGTGRTSWAWNQAYAQGTRWPKSGPWTWLWLLAEETQRYVPAILGCAL